jgi:hypothetical protein
VNQWWIAGWNSLMARDSYSTEVADSARWVSDGCETPETVNGEWKNAR